VIAEDHYRRKGRCVFRIRALGRMAQLVGAGMVLVTAIVATGLPLSDYAYAASDTTWIAQSSGESGMRLVGVSCVSAMSCWAVGSWGTTVGTSNGGSTWSAESSGYSNWFYGVSCPTASRCWAVTVGGNVYTTANGGTTWSPQSSVSVRTSLWGVSCPTASNCWAVGQTGTIIDTGDAGTVWQQQASGTLNALYGITCAPASTSTCWSVGSAGTILATTNGGLSWSSQQSGTTQSLRAVSCSSASSCVAVGDGGVILTTSDGGSQWSPQSSGTANDLLGVSCPVGGSWCWAVGRGGTVLSGGPSSWTSESSGTTNDLYAVSCPTTAQCWAVGDWSPSGQAVIISGAAPPLNSSLPQISGPAQQGQVLFATNGTWDGAPPFTYAYQWQDCDSSGGNCANIGGATGATFTLAQSDVGSTIRVIVTATNPAGSATATSAPTVVVASAPPLPPPGFVYAEGNRLFLDGSPYRFIGLNVYWANGCSQTVSTSTLSDSLSIIHQDGGNVVRAWFFQPDVTVNGVRDWTTFDNTLQAIASQNMKVIVTLADEYGNCGDQPSTTMKDINWYQTGYQSTIYPGTTETYLDYVRDIAARYANHPEILAWQLMNEASVIQPDESCNESAGASALRAWADNVSAAIRSVDPYHLISLGTGVQGGCGYQVTSDATSNDYGYVHAGPNIDLCEYHDYYLPSTALPLDEQEEMDTCQTDDGKPFFVGETGITATTGDLLSEDTRESEFKAKFDAQFGYSNEPAQGELIWDWCAVSGGVQNDYCVRAGDPTMNLLSQY